MRNSYIILETKHEKPYRFRRKIKKRLKVKDSPNRPGVAQRVPGGLGSQIFMTFGI
jgi:hypothetical protein